ncbi:MAG: transporter [Candidatus Omnitrophica bacterium]|nr:transporter [Candidatus Omnitrophota bacterium]
MIPPRFLGFGALILLVPTSAFAVAINSDVGLTPAKDQWIVRSQLRYTKKSDDPTAHDRELEIFAMPQTVVYGFTEKASAILTIPFVSKELDSTTDGLRTSRGDAGVGDLLLLGKYRVYTRDYPAATSRFSLVAGTDLPTGQSGDADARGKLPRDLQLGSGSADPLVGAAYTWQSLDDEWDVSMTYQVNTTANKFEFGDVLSYTVAYQRRVWPIRLPERGLYAQWNVVLEANGQWEQQAKNHGSRVDNTGGHLLFLSPGVQVATKHFVIESSIQLPVLQNLNGNQVEPDFTLVGSIRVTF